MIGLFPVVSQPINTYFKMNFLVVILATAVLSISPTIATPTPLEGAPAALQTCPITQVTFKENTALQCSRGRNDHLNIVSLRHVSIRPHSFPGPLTRNHSLHAREASGTWCSGVEQAFTTSTMARYIVSRIGRLLKKNKCRKS